MKTFYTKTAAMMKTPEAEIQVTVNIIEMQIQEVTCDCGLFSIATATALLNGIYPGECTFNQSQMCQHGIKEESHSSLC